VPQIHTLGLIEYFLKQFLSPPAMVVFIQNVIPKLRKESDPDDSFDVKNDGKVLVNVPLKVA
jgi:hypothetical protein